MSMPALRKPKFDEPALKTVKRPVCVDVQNVILTLKGEKRLVTSSDSYNGILTEKEMYKCVFCKVNLQLDGQSKELHKNAQSHLKAMESFPFLNGYAENLVRQLRNERFYCTICHVVIMSPYIIKHVATDVHQEKLKKASAMALVYDPVN